LKVRYRSATGADDIELGQLVTFLQQQLG